jgi:hemerythrin-like domain-containing protein
LAGSAGLGIATIISFPTARADEAAADKGDEEEISAPEDLMREHGVLNRILLIYEEGLRRLRAKQDVPPEVFHKPATLVRSFVEDYHEKLEETFIFPAFEKRNKLVELVTVLKQQHAAGRRVTDVVLQNAVGDQFHKAENRKKVIESCEAFIRMYRPHETREDTVLFPALYKVIGAKDVKNLGEQFEEKEHKLFGEDGFEKAVDEVAAIEKQLGIYDLASFTPK